MNKTGDSKGARDLKWGAKAIGECIGVDARRAYYLLETGEIPGRKIGGKWVSSETVLLDHIIGYSSDLRIHRDEIRRQSGETDVTGERRLDARGEPMTRIASKAKS